MIMKIILTHGPPRKLSGTPLQEFSDPTLRIAILQ